MQMVAQGYLAYQLTGSAFWVGIVAAVSQLPSTFFALVGGALVDRFYKRDLLRITQSLQFIVSTILGLVIITGHINLYSLMAFTFLLGLINAVDQPARISLPNELVDKEDLHSAIAMNMSMFNSARIVGPAVAGWLIVAFGVGWAFLLNGLSFLAPLLAFNFIRFAPFIKKPHIGTLSSIKQGLSYTFTHQQIKLLIIYLAMISIFGWSYTVILPVISEEVFKLGPEGLGYLYSFAGAGSVLGALAASAYTKNINPRKAIFFGGLLYAIALILFSFTSNLYLALALLFITGFGMTTQGSTIQATIQKTVEDNFRGRVSSIQSLMLMGMHPVGSFQVGTIAEHYGSQVAVRVGGIAIFISAVVLFVKTPKKH